MILPLAEKMREPAQMQPALWMVSTKQLNPYGGIHLRAYFLPPTLSYAQTPLTCMASSLNDEAGMRGRTALLYGSGTPSVAPLLAGKRRRAAAHFAEHPHRLHISLPQRLCTREARRREEDGGTQAKVEGEDGVEVRGGNAIVVGRGCAALCEGKGEDGCWG